MRLLPLFLILFVAIPFFNGFAQVDFNHYKFCENHSAASSELIEAMRLNLREEINALDTAAKFYVVRRLNYERTSAIVNMVKRGAFIKDDSLETYVNNVLVTILRRNGVTRESARVLILDSPYINAYCFGQGVYVVTIGMLGRINGEDELAFALAHEVAHDILGHVKKRLIREVEIELAKKTREQIKKIVLGTVETEDIEEYRTLIYGVRRHNRAREIEADSAGIVLARAAGYRQDAATSLLTVLEEPLKPKFDIGVDLILPFDAAEYPLQESWFRKRLSIYSRGATDSYLYSVDSLESHPDIDLRKGLIESYIRDDISVDSRSSPDFVNAATLLAEFETLQSAFESRALDRCLFYALQLLDRYPENPYLISQIGRILIWLYETKDNHDNTFHSFVPRYTANYSAELTLVNNMLHNLPTRDLGELTFHFLKERFNPKEPAHYFLLWRICGLTYRRDMAGELKKSYRQKFDSNIAGFYFPQPRDVTPWYLRIKK